MTTLIELLDGLKSNLATLMDEHGIPLPADSEIPETTGTNLATPFPNVSVSICGHEQDTPVNWIVPEFLINEELARKACSAKGSLIRNANDVQYSQNAIIALYIIIATAAKLFQTLGIKQFYKLKAISPRAIQENSEGESTQAIPAKDKDSLEAFIQYFITFVKFIDSDTTAYVPKVIDELSYQTAKEYLAFITNILNGVEEGTLSLRAGGITDVPENAFSFGKNELKNTLFPFKLILEARIAQFEALQRAKTQQVSDPELQRLLALKSQYLTEIQVLEATSEELDDYSPFLKPTLEAGDEGQTASAII